jgi:hypothetical protein
VRTLFPDHAEAARLATLVQERLLARRAHRPDSSLLGLAALTGVGTAVAAWGSVALWHGRRGRGSRRPGSRRSGRRPTRGRGPRARSAGRPSSSRAVRTRREP